MSGSARNVCLPLPNTITNSATTYESREQFLVNYLERVLPSSDNKDVLEELKRTFIFDKHKSSRSENDSKKGNRKKCFKHKNLRPKILGTKHGLKYVEMLQLNEMWVEYMRQHLRVKDFIDLPRSPTESNWDNINERLVRADFHGAIVTVVRSKNPSTVGMNGIIILETKNCFQILSAKNRLITLPKNSSLFEIHLPHASLEVLGSEIQHKPAERSVKKFKAIHFRDL